MADKEAKKEEVGEVQEEDKKERQEETQVPSAAPLHGKKKTKGKKLKPRRKKKSILGALEEEGEDPTETSVVADLKALQQERLRFKGLSSEQLIKGDEAERRRREEAKKRAAKPEEEEQQLFGLQKPQENLDNMMNSTFTAQKKEGPDQTHKLMEEYIEQRLGKRTAEPEEEKVITEEDKLYEVPKELQIGLGGVDEEGTGAPLAWNTGIAEVELPVEFKLKNIEDTERARREFQQGKGRSHYHSATTGSFTANYAHHRKEYARSMKGGHGRGSNFEERSRPAPSTGDKRTSMATDDMVLDRFRKRQRR